VVARYVLFNLPGWILASAAAAAAVRWEAISISTALLLVVLWVGKDFLLYPLVRVAYEPGTDKEPMAGALAIAEEPLAPRGYVRVRGELWRAQLAPGQSAVARGASLRVCSVEGLTLIVETDAQGEEG
jgi:membrane protein implicated in regulation of membrane protease activity